MLRSFYKLVAAFGAHAPFPWLIVASWHAHRSTVIIVAHTDSLKGLGVDDIMFVAGTTACLWFAEGAVFVGTGARVCARVNDGEVHAGTA